MQLPKLPTSSVCLVSFITAWATPIAFFILRRFATAPTSYVHLKPQHTINTHIALNVCRICPMTHTQNWKSGTVLTRKKQSCLTIYQSPLAYSEAPPTQNTSLSSPETKARCSSSVRNITNNYFNMPQNAPCTCTSFCAINWTKIKIRMQADNKAGWNIHMTSIWYKSTQHSGWIKSAQVEFQCH